MAADMRRATGPATAISTNDAGVLYERYSRRILAYCLHALRDRGEAEDAVQTTFLQAHRALAKGTTPEHEFAWLHTIAKNVCRVQKRTAARRAVVTGVDLDTFPAHDAADQSERLRGLGEALARMPETQRRALLMREWQGLSPAEVASQMGMSAPATYALLTRARRSLTDALTTVKGRSALGLNVGPFLLRLKTLFAGGTAKVATTTAVAVAVAASGATIEARLVHRSPDASIVEPNAAGGATATPVSAVVVGTMDAVTASVRPAHRPRGGAPTGVSDDAVVARGRAQAAGSTDAPIADLPRIEPASPPGPVGVPETPGAVDDRTLDPVVQHVPDPLPELPPLPTVEEVGSTASVEVPPVPDLPPQLPLSLPPLP